MQRSSFCWLKNRPNNEIKKKKKINVYIWQNYPLSIKIALYEI